MLNNYPYILISKTRTSDKNDTSTKNNSLSSKKQRKKFRKKFKHQHESANSVSNDTNSESTNITEGSPSNKKNYFQNNKTIITMRNLVANLMTNRDIILLHLIEILQCLLSTLCTN